MTYRNILTIGAIISVVFGIGFVLAAVPLMAVYNITLSEGGGLIGRLFGAELIAFAALDWFSRDLSDSKTRQVVVTANLVGTALGFILTLIAQLGGVGGVNAFGWSTVAIYLLLGLAFAYLRFGTQMEG